MRRQSPPAVPSPSAEPAVLPPEEQVRTVSVERDGVAADCGNREQIGELLSILADMEPTNLQSVQDVPAGGCIYIHSF